MMLCCDGRERGNVDHEAAVMRDKVVKSAVTAAWWGGLKYTPLDLSGLTRLYVQISAESAIQTNAT